MTVDFGVSPVTPAITSLAPATAISENGTAVVNGTFSDTNTAATHAVTLDWGDGTVPTAAVVDEASHSFSAAHHYLDNPAGQPDGAYNVTATLAASTGTRTQADTAVTVANADDRRSGHAPAAAAVASSPGRFRTFSRLCLVRYVLRRLVCAITRCDR